ncbi:MAG TPA: cytochrome C oxidase subunit I [Chitinophagales bacterium]|nr:cytochrome C oxidase subunit I [Chitinophagales bacterium]HRP38081.1 cytochrome C oxidase subunit I [Chitinophagales bacterium]
MIGSPFNTALIKTTSHKVVIPFYVYAAFSFLVATLLLLTSSGNFAGHYFHPHILAITHTMALGWGCMVVFGASHQLVPVLIEGKLHSEKLAYATFYLAAVGIPILVAGFYVFDMGILAKVGGSLVVASVLTYLANIFFSITESKKKNPHATFIFSAVFWLLLTVLLGLALVFNFTQSVFPNNSLHYLPLHAHLGIVGWFLLLVFGVGSRLIPMFLISKYTNPKLLYFICYLINAALVFYFTSFFFFDATFYVFIPIAGILLSVVLFLYYCYHAYKKRLRRAVDEQVKISILSIVLLLIPIVTLATVSATLILGYGENTSLILAYGFLIFFGWLTAIILGMTFKTLTFISWNKVYRHRSSIGKTLSPKDLFNHTVFNAMSLTYLVSLLLFTAGIILILPMLLKVGAALMLLTAVLYVFNVFKVINHKALVL